MVVTRFFVVEPDHAVGYKANLIPDDDVLPISDLQAVTVATLLDGRKIIHAILPDYILQAMREATDPIDPLTLEGVIALGITTRYAGEDRADVLVNFPELEGQVKIGVDEEGENIMVDKLLRHRWLDR